MIEMTWILEFIRGAVWFYIAVWVGLTVAAFVLPKTTSRRITALLAVTVLFGALPAYLALSVKSHNDEQRPIVDQRKAQYEAAMARFEERCKTAGEKIYRTVENVEGVLLVKTRPRQPSGADRDPFWPEAGMPERTGDDYLMSFLRNTERNPEYLDSQGRPLYPGSVGYKYIDAIDSLSGNLVRYTAPYEKRSNDQQKVQMLTKGPVGAKSKFGVTYDVFVNSEDRQYWIAGGVIRIIDLYTKQVIAEKTGYLIDPQQGAIGGARDPWGWAHSYGPKCPKDWGQGNPTRSFVDRVLKPKMGE